MIAKLSDTALVKEVKTKVRMEKKLVTEVLSYLEEIDRRKLFVEHGTSSLFKFCVRILGYSEAEAALRVKAVRAIKVKPIIKKKIKEGEISLSTAAALQPVIHDKKVEDLDKLIEDVSNKTHKEAQEHLGKVTGKKKNGLKINLNEQVLKKLQEVQKDFDQCSEVEAIEALIDKHLEEIRHAKAKRKSTGSKKQRHIPRDVKEYVDKRAKGQCEAVYNGERCTARTHLQYEHECPVAVGGQSTKENIRKLCPACNARAGVRSLGVEKMTQHFADNHHTSKTKGQMLLPIFE